jgi:hypothetical protein
VLVLLMDCPLTAAGGGECPAYNALSDLAWDRAPASGISNELAAGVDDILKRFYTTECLSVDRSRLGESEEAWVYVRINPLKFRLGVSVSSEAGVLVWPNSD